MWIVSWDPWTVHFVSYTVNPCDVTIHVLKKKTKRQKTQTWKCCWALWSLISFDPVWWPDPTRIILRGFVIRVLWWVWLPCFFFFFFLREWKYCSHNLYSFQGFQTWIVHWTVKGRDSKFLRSNWGQIVMTS